MRVLDLFSGIGGFSLGLERAGGFRTVAFCEIDPYCRAVLNKYWPGVPVYEDVRTLRAADIGAVDLICGGFPCQDLSYAGKGAGINGERSGLWREFARLIGELRPRYALVENVSALLGRGMARVLGDLAQIGYDAEWHAIPASAVGAPHRRDRVWIVAYPVAALRDEQQRMSRRRTDAVSAQGQAEPGDDGAMGPVDSDADSGRQQERVQLDGDALRAVADSCRPRLEIGVLLARVQSGARFADAGPDTGLGSWWESEPRVGRVAHGIPARVDRLRALGNSLVPQIPELIGRAIMSYESAA